MAQEESSKPKTTTALGFNNHRLHRNPVDVEHPESPDRVELIRRRLADAGLLEQCLLVESPSEDYSLCDADDFRQCHDAGYVGLLEEQRNRSQDELNEFVKRFDSVFMTSDSLGSAHEAVSVCRHLAEQIMEEKVANGFALVRPPGHHASSDEASGFCLFNNAAQAAEAAFNSGADRILIVDLDVHHGNGTQKIYYDTDRVLYFSVHRHQQGAFWPHLKESNYDHIGAEKGRGYNVNVPLNEVTCLSACQPVTCPPVTCLSACQLVCHPVPVNLSTCLSVCHLSTCPPVTFLSTCQPVNLSICHSVPLYLSLCPCLSVTCPPVTCLSTCQPVHLSIVCPLVHLSVTLSTCLSFCHQFSLPTSLSTCPVVPCPPVHLTELARTCHLQLDCTDGDYLAIFWNVLWPLAVQYNPQFVIISAGFDCLYGDPLGRMELTPDCYAHLIYQLKALAGGKLLMVLEGGYHHQTQADAVERCVRVLLGATPARLLAFLPPKRTTVTSCLNVINQLRPFWKCYDIYAPVGSGASYALAINADEPGDESARSNTANVDQSKLLQYAIDRKPEFPGSVPLLVFVDNKRSHFNQQDRNHPERPERVTQLRDYLLQQGISPHCQLSAFRYGTHALRTTDFEETHERPYLMRLNRIYALSPAQRRAEEQSMTSVYLTTESMPSASEAASACCKILDEILSAEGPQRGFAAIRPPGHHAGLACGSGFCLLNNVAIAANYARSKFGIRRVLILDWDVHHGDGTQEIFDETDEILYISLHRHDEGHFFPVGAHKEHSYHGQGQGRGFSVNIPWSYDHMGDAEYLAAFSKIVMPIAYEFNPELVLISAGFDAAQGDPLGEYKLSPVAYSLMTYQLAGLAGGKLLAVLEGGYNIQSICVSSAAVIETLISGKPIASLDFGQLKEPVPFAQIAMRRVLAAQAAFWRIINGFQLLGEYGSYPELVDSSSSDEDEPTSTTDSRKMETTP